MEKAGTADDQGLSAPEAEQTKSTTSLKLQSRSRTEDVQSDAKSFEDLLLPPHMVASLAKAGYYKPSPVQLAAIPLGRLGSDLIVQAKSGTGKTVVFSVICLDRINKEVNATQV